MNTINNNLSQPLSKPRQPWLDIIRGICAVMVVLSHVTSTPLIYGIFYSPIMIPAFFFVSGYLSKNYDGSIVKFLYNRVLKLVIAYAIIIFCDKITNFTNIMAVIQNPKYLIQLPFEYFNYIRYGYNFWFIPCLVCISVYFIIINKICNDKPLPMFIISVIIAATGLCIVKPDQFVNWHAHTATICLFFYITGYYVKKKDWIENYNFTWKSCILTGILYFAAVIIFSLIFGMENIYIVAANNEWKILPVTIVLIFLGILFIVCLSKQISSCKLLSYIGAHSLIYFAFASRCMDICQQLIKLIAPMTGLAFLSEPLIISIPISVIGCLLTLIICKLSDKFFPVLNGTIRLPELKTKKAGA